LNNHKFIRNFDLRGTLLQLKKEISGFTSLLNKKRENFDAKFTYSIDENKAVPSDFDFIAFNLNGQIQNDQHIKTETDLVNEKSYKILYKKMKEFMFDDEIKTEAKKITKNNKRIIGIVNMKFN
jgi:hypothetical protein